jgi:hypothetical protein
MHIEDRVMTLVDIGTGDAAHADIEPTALHIIDQVGPFRGDDLPAYTERLGAAVREVDVDPGILAGCLVQQRERSVVAGQADAQHAARRNLVEPRLRSRAGCKGADQEQNEQNPDQAHDDLSPR